MLWRGRREFFTIISQICQKSKDYNFAIADGDESIYIDDHGTPYVYYTGVGLTLVLKGKLARDLLALTNAFTSLKVTTAKGPQGL